MQISVLQFGSLEFLVLSTAAITEVDIFKSGYRPLRTEKESVLFPSLLEMEIQMQICHQKISADLT